MKADAKVVVPLLKTARGQLDGLLRMVEDNRYCMDISNQLLATISILNKVNREVLKAHLQNCVKEAVLEGKEEEKIDEILLLLDKISK